MAVVVRPASSPVFRSPGAAHGLLVVGEGATVSRRGALASLVRGEMGNAIVNGGLPGGDPLISVSARPARTTFYVALPPPGRHHNVDRYAIAVRGPGYTGLLTDTSTRLPGLVSIADVAPSVRALERGRRPRIRSQDDADPLGRLARLDRRLARAHDSRLGGMLVLVVLMLALSLLALLTRSAAAARAALLAPPACIGSAVAASAAGISTPWQAVTVTAVAGTAAAVAGGVLLRPRLPLALALAAFFALLFAVMWARPAWNALAVIGPHPDGGGRFYGVTNQVETLLLPAALLLGALAGQALPAVALVLAAGIAASRVGADGGGLVVYLAGFLVLWLRLRRLPAARAVAAAAAAAGVALLLVGVDAATGGSSHVTRAVGGGPGSVLGDLGHRLHLSAAAVASTWNAALLFALGIAALVVLALQRPRFALLDAYLAALAVSLLVNDTPVDVAGWGGLAALGVWLFARSEETAGRLQ
ncbi:MAG TPA: hypothetical protein VLD13_06095 [Gaiellaceae bacterium]|nr:hypothetical protein [Gaiellaceae bacterium]